MSSLADEAERMDQLSVAVSNALTISTSSGVYLDKNLSQLGIVRPAELGMDDFAFRQMGIQINAQKQITEVIHTVLETFFKDEAVRAYTQCTQPAPYDLRDGDTLLVEFEDGVVREIPFQTSDFINIFEATAAEVADVITRYLSEQNLNGYATAAKDLDTGNDYVRIFGSAKGPHSLVIVRGGRVQNKLEWPYMRATDLGTNNNTNWVITRTKGSTYRIRWYSGTKPKLYYVKPGDSVMIYGPAFETVGITGTFTVTNVRPASQTPNDPAAGYFEIELPDFYGLRSSLPDVLPPINNPPSIYSYVVGQASYDDLKFFLPKRATSYSQPRYALAWESSKNKLKIYVPATTKAIRRDLIGAAHLHLLYGPDNFSSGFGSTTPGDFDNKVEVVSDRSIRFRQAGYDNLGYGGKLSYSNPGLVEVDIAYVSRENGYTLVTCTEPHGLPNKNWSLSSNYNPGDTIIYRGIGYTALIATGPATAANSRQPDKEPLFWQSTGVAQDFCDIIVVVSGVNVPTDDPVNTFLGPYVVDPAVKYSLRSESGTIMSEIIAGNRLSTLECRGQFPNEAGLLLFGLNTDKQEGPVKFYTSQITTDINGPKSTLTLDSSYSFKYSHDVGTDVTLLSDRQAYIPDVLGTDYGPYITDTAAGRVFAQNVIRQITALGINLEIIVIYPSDIGLGNEGESTLDNVSPQSEAVYVWGPTGS